MPSHRLRAALATATAGVACAIPPAATALAAPAPLPYGTGNPGRYFHIIPPGQGGGTTALQAVRLTALGTRPPHADDQRDRYTNLLYASPGLPDDRIEEFFPDATFGIRPGQVESTSSPREDVTIQRDGFGRPHITGSTRPGTMFGSGYASAQDCLVFMDVLRHYGAGQLTWAGGANKATDEDTWTSAPYSAADRAAMVAQLGTLYGPTGRQVLVDISDYVSGINAYIARIGTDPTLLPAEYAALGHPEGPQPWTPTDVLAVATLIGGQLGNGGGNELAEVRLLMADMQRFGPTGGYKIWRELREVDDPEAPVTATAKRGFPYGAVPKRLSQGVAIPDAGSLKTVSPVVASTGSGTTPGADTRQRPGVDRALLRFPTTDSNALLVSAKQSKTGHPLAVFGSQAGYFEPEIWRYQDIHGPGIDSAGASVPGTGPYVEIGHGPDYAWSATSAGQDIIDVYALDLCAPDGSPPKADAEHYRFHGACVAMERIDHQLAWAPSLADTTAAGSETLRALRTKLGIVVARATIKGKPVAYTKLRSTYRHELDSAIAFSEWNDPAKIPNAKAFQNSAFKLGYTFNWLYTDDRDIAYINTGANPIRPRGANGVLPQRGGSARAEWKGLDTAAFTQANQPQRERPQAINQPSLVSWNNKQARHCCGNGPFGPVWRSQTLSEAIDRELKAHGGKLGLADLVDAAQVGSTTDLRGTRTLPWALKLLGTPKEPALADAVAKLRAWIADGAHRRDQNRDGHYEHADAIRVADTWMQTMPRAVFEPRLGKAAFEEYDAELRPDVPNSFHDQTHAHLGSSWENGWFGLLQKDLRTVAGKLRGKTRVQQPWSVRYCGRGRLGACRAALAASLTQALAVDPAKLYADPTTAGKCGSMDAQVCYDSLAFKAIGLLTQPNLPWQNRPTQQQVVEVTGHRPR
ncbi:MAG: Penicillin amidase [Solirubrobacterales bacterium]|nr:Penicillin amidase [Solirubrobacterales bacterium]